MRCIWKAATAVGLACSALLAGAATAADATAPGAADEMARQPWQKDLQVLAVMATVDRAVKGGSPAVDAHLERAEQARQRGELGEMRRELSQALVRLSGETWTEATEFAASLVLRSSDVVHDPGGLFVATLAQQFPTSYRLSGDARARARLLRGSVFGRGAGRSRPEEVVRELGTHAVLTRDLMDTPFSLAADLHGVPDGDYRLRVEVSDGGRPRAVVETNVHVVRGLVAAGREVERRLAALEGHESTQASVRYPFDLARTWNQGVRQPMPYDFAAGVARALRLLDSLERGEDPLWRATGDHERHYYLASADRLEPYRIYVPAAWDGEAKLPLLVALHGSFGDHNSFFALGDVVKELADRYQWAIAAPAGYAHNSVFGSRGRVVLANGSAPPARPLAIDGAVLSADEFQPSPAEQDVLRVVELMKDEYGIDEDRVFLTGASMGGEGVWHLGAKYSHLWAALAPVSAALHPDDLDVRQLADVPVLAVHGDADPITSWEASRDVVERLNAHGGDAAMLRLEGRGHSVWGESLEAIFAFFDEQAPAR